VLLAGVLLVAAAPPPLLEITAGDTIPVVINGETLRIAVDTANVDRLVVNAATIARLGIEPATLKGKATLGIGPTVVLNGRNRPMDHRIAGAPSGDRIVWFDGLDASRFDGSIGPWSIPHDRVAFRLPGKGATRRTFPLSGSVDSLGYTLLTGDGYRFGLTFGVEESSRYPVASAAAGADIAKALGGIASPETWEEEVLLGIRRPVRRVDLATPLVIGPWRFATIAVRVRDARDGMGAGGDIPQAPRDDDDPSEITVTASAAKGPQPIRTLSIGAAALAQCSRLEYAKAARQIILDC
jgi:hypothetical protein